MNNIQDTHTKHTMNNTLSQTYNTDAHLQTKHILNIKKHSSTYKTLSQTYKPDSHHRKHTLTNIQNTL